MAIKPHILSQEWALAGGCAAVGTNLLHTVRSQVSLYLWIVALDQALGTAFFEKQAQCYTSTFRATSVPFAYATFNG